MCNVCKFSSIHDFNVPDKVAMTFWHSVWLLHFAFVPGHDRGLPLSIPTIMTKKKNWIKEKKFGWGKMPKKIFGNCQGLQNWGFSLHDRLHSWYPGACFEIGFLNAIWLFWSGFHDGFFPWWAWSPQRQLVPAMLNTEKYTSLVVLHGILYWIQHPR